MWIFTKEGFFSAVQHYENPELLVVRSRCRAHANKLAKVLEHIFNERFDVEFTPNADYCARTVVTKSEWVDYLTHAGVEIDYTNVKDNIGKNDSKFHRAMMNCWSAMNNFQESTEGVGLYVQHSKMFRHYLAQV